jgi:hypothetical protein
MNLTPIALACLLAYSSNMATGYQTPDVSKQFSVTGPMETKLRAAILDSVEFLKLITMMDVDQIKGQVVSVGLMVVLLQAKTLKVIPMNWSKLTLVPLSVGAH